jgi:hypothetical protein
MRRWSWSTFAGASLLASALAFGAQEPVYSSPGASKSEARSVSSSSLEHHPNHMSVRQIDGTPTSAWPSGLVQDECKYSAFGIKLIPGYVETRSNWDGCVQRKSTGSHFGSFLYNPIIDDRCQRFGDDTVTRGEIIYGSTSGEISLMVDSTLAGRKPEALVIGPFDRPFISREINSREWTNGKRVELQELRNDMTGGQERTMFVYEECCACSSYYVNFSRISLCGADNGSQGLLNIRYRINKGIGDLGESTIRVAENKSNENKKVPDEEITSGKVVGPIGTFANRCAINESPETWDVKCPASGIHIEPSEFDPIGRCSVGKCN